MRLLNHDETAKEGDWFYIFVGKGFWFQMDESPRPLFRKTLRELDQENKRACYPIVVMRPARTEKFSQVPPAIAPAWPRKLRKHWIKE